MAEGKAAALYAEERRSAIVGMLDRGGSVQVAQLAEAFGVSRVTIRSDLEALEQAGKLRRTHGGAVSLQSRVTVSVQERRVNVNVEAKRAIARGAAMLVDDGDSIMVDSGTTSLELVRALAHKRDLTIVTCDLTVADFVDSSLPGAEVVMLGGHLRKGHRYTSGPLAVAALGLLHPDKAFVCPTAYAPGHGLLTNNREMAELKTAILGCASLTYVLMDASKVGARGLMVFGQVTSADAVVMDKDPQGLVAADVEGTSTRMVLAG